MSKAIEEAIQYLHTRKAKVDPMLQFLFLLNKDYFYYYCLNHPEVFTDETVYQQFLKMYAYEHSFRRETKDYYHHGTSSSFDYNIRNLVNENINYQYNRFNKKNLGKKWKNYIHDITLRLNLNNIKNEEQEEQRRKYREHYENNRQEIEDTPDNSIDNMKKVNDIIDKFNKKTERIKKKIDKDAENKLKWRTEMMKQEGKRKYKVWIQTPNPRTRHTITNGQKVPLAEKFEVINDKTGKIDYMDYPGDGLGSISNTINCLCEIEFTDDDTDVYDPYKKSVMDEYKDLVEYQENLKEYLDGIKERNTKTQKQLREQYIKENGKLPDYITDEKTELAFTEYDGRVNLIHIFGGKSHLIFDERTGKSNDMLYNNVSKHFNATKQDYLNSKSKETYNFYTGDDFSEFNTWKRIGDSYLTDVLKLSPELAKQRKKIYQEKEKELMKLTVPLGIDTMAYRGQRDIYHDLTPGSVGVWDSFTSTSLGIGSAWGYAKGNYIYEIPLKEYNKVIPILQQGMNTKEIEMLLPPGQRFKVGEVRREFGCTIIPITLI